MAEDILNRVFSFISGDNEADPKKKEFLRQILRDINENKYTRFYKSRAEEIEPAFAHTVYEIYKVIYPASLFIRDINKASRIRQLALEVFMDKPTLTVIRRLNHAQVEERLKTTPPKELIPQLTQELSMVSAAFDEARTHAVNVTNNQISAFSQFVTYPFFTVLQQFDINFPEKFEGYQPKFAPIKAKDIIKYLEKLYAILPLLNPDENWKTVLGIMRLSNGGTDVLPLEQWNAVTRLVRDIRDSNILERIIQYTIRDPLWQGKLKIPNEYLAETWLGNKQTEIQHIISDLTTKEWKVLVRSLAKNIFGSADVVRLQCYTEQESENLIRRGLDGYDFAGGINYLMAFIGDFVDREFQDLCDILLIRGQWTTSASSREMSEAVHGIKETSGKLIELDEALGEKGKDGSRIRTALVRVDHDRSQARYINAIVGGVNDEAQEYLTAAAKYFTVIENSMKHIVEDFEKNLHELIMNWKELTAVSKSPLGQRLNDAYQKISSIVQLLNCFSQKPEEE
ncbi:MAG: DUF5312 family protein [Spirochaetaceae bacterium]|jgi:hypothetical protein|nr:DUF5312 family protein [Spirochaetaceae bacterium]